MLPGVVPGWSHCKRELNQTPGWALHASRNVADRLRVAQLGISPEPLLVDLDEEIERLIEMLIDPERKLPCLRFPNSLTIPPSAPA